MRSASAASDDWSVRACDFNVSRASLDNRSTSSEFRRGLIARASSGGNSSFSISISGWSRFTIIDPLGFLKPSLGLSIRDGRGGSFSPSEDIVDEVDECRDGGGDVDGSADIGMLSDMERSDAMVRGMAREEPRDEERREVAYCKSVLTYRSPRAARCLMPARCFGPGG